MVALDFYPPLRARTLNFLGSSESNNPSTTPSSNDAVELEDAAAEGLVLAMVDRMKSFIGEPQSPTSSQKMPLITVEDREASRFRRGKRRLPCPVSAHWEWVT